MMVKGDDGEMVECEIVSTRDHESVCSKHAPVLPLPIAIICCILNIVPGMVAIEFLCRNAPIPGLALWPLLLCHNSDDLFKAFIV